MGLKAGGVKEPSDEGGRQRMAKNIDFLEGRRTKPLKPGRARLGEGNTLKGHRVVTPVKKLLTYQMETTLKKKDWN